MATIAMAQSMRFMNGLVSACLSAERLAAVTGVGRLIHGEKIDVVTHKVHSAVAVGHLDASGVAAGGGPRVPLRVVWRRDDPAGALHLRVTLRGMVDPHEVVRAFQRRQPALVLRMYGLQKQER